MSAPGMDEVARVAGCSRATVYRYFENRKALQVAFAHREARMIVELVSRNTAAISAPQLRAVAAVTGVLEAIRERPHLVAWYRGDIGLLPEIFAESPVIESFAARFVGAPDHAPDVLTARWLLRCILSLLMVPGADEQEERQLIERFLAPHLIPQPVASGMPGPGQRQASS